METEEKPLSSRDQLIKIITTAMPNIKWKELSSLLNALSVEVEEVANKQRRETK